MCVRFLLPLALLSSLMSISAHAENINAENISPIKALLPNAYTEIQLRHYSDVLMNGEQWSRTTPQAQARAIIGSKFYNGKMKSEFTFGLKKDTETTRITQRRPQWFTKYDIVNNDYFELTPNADLYLPFEGSGTLAKLGTLNRAKLPISTAIGAFSLESRADFYVVQGSAEEKSVVFNEIETNGGGYSLVDSKTTTTKKDPSINTQYGLALAYKPEMVKGLKIRLEGIANRWFDPRYVNDGGVAYFDGYTGQTVSANLLEVSYKISDVLTIKNEAYQSFDGMYDARWNSANTSIITDKKGRFTNVARLSYTLL